MVPNKFEKHIKKELKEREIRPSADAWDRLSERLDTDVPPSKKRNYFWYGIAASFIGILFISVMFFNSRNTSEVRVVETNDQINNEKTDDDTIVVRESEGELVENDTIRKSSVIEINTVVENQIPELKDKITSTEKFNRTIDKPSEKVIVSNDFKEAIINTKILEVIAAVDSLEQNSEALTEAEVDDLLRNAQEEIFRNKLFNQNGSVDALALLNEVEDELDKSFRDQIFESLKTGFLKVRTAVADRNK